AHRCDDWQQSPVAGIAGTRMTHTNTNRRGGDAAARQAGSLEANRLPDTSIANSAQLSLEELAAAIQAAHEAAQIKFRQTLRHALQAGDFLLAAKHRLKERVGHGHWRQWIQERFPDISRRSLQAYMQIASHRETIEANTQGTAHLTLEA